MKGDNVSDGSKLALILNLEDVSTSPYHDYNKRGYRVTSFNLHYYERTEIKA